MVYVNNRDHKTAILKTAITKPRCTKSRCVKIAIIKIAISPCGAFTCSLAVTDSDIGVVDQPRHPAPRLFVCLKPTSQDQLVIVTCKIWTSSGLEKAGMAHTRL